MQVRPVLSKKSTVEVVERMRKVLGGQAEVPVTPWHVEAEVIEDHVMRATVSIGSLGVKFSIFADEPQAIGGDGSAMPPFGYFLAGALLCEMAQYTWNAAMLGITDNLSQIKLKMEGGFPIKPLYGLDDRPGASAITGLKITTEIAGDASPELVEQLARQASQRCPAHQSLAKGIPVQNHVHLNGQAIADF